MGQPVASSDPEPASVMGDITKLRSRHDDLTSECTTIRNKLAQLAERIKGFTPTSELDADRDDDAAEIAQLEADLAEVEAETDVANPVELSGCPVTVCGANQD